MKNINKDLLNERIVCSAVHCDNGKTNHQTITNIHSGIVVYGRRHHDCMKILDMIKDTDGCGVKITCGFLTNSNRFVSREEGYVIAKRENQIWHDMIVESKCSFDKPILCSEDLYYTIGEDC